MAEEKVLKTSGLLHLWDIIKSSFVAKESGKGLSSNDYTTDEKTKLAGIAENANNYILPQATKQNLGGVKTGSSVSSTEGLVAAPIINGVVYYKDTDTTYSQATTSKDGLMSSSDYLKLSQFGDASIYALKSDISAMYKYKGNVATVSMLPSTGNTSGDVYNVEENGMNYAWTGTEWDALGGLLEVEAITNDEIDDICK